MADIANTTLGIGTLLLGISNAAGIIVANRRVGRVHDEVRTGNGNTIGALADLTEGRRVSVDIPHDQRTSAEQHYVEGLPDSGRPQV